ncbi:multidrug ABC transporter ATP-binding protein [Erysipelotrichaceae bacterium]|nr:multidrug ABC transporter ATP-binding protein [Erysipelotrichaceae bacterium]
MNIMIRYIKKYKKLLALNFISVFGFVIIELGLPTLLAKIVDEGIIAQKEEVIFQYAMMMLGIIIIGLIGVLFLAYFAVRISTNVVRDIRDELFAKTRTFSATEVNHFGVASLMTRTNNDPYQVMLFTQMLLRIGMITPIMFVASIVMAIKTSPSLSLTLAVAFPLLIIAVIWMAILSAPLSRRQQRNLDSINRIMRESLTGIRVIRAFVREKFQQGRFEKINDDYTKTSKSLFYLMALAVPAFGILFSSIIVAIIWFGTNLVGDGSLRIGQLTAFIDYIFHALFSFMMFTTLFAMYPRAAVSAARIQEVLKTEPNIVENDGGIDVSTLHGVIEFKDVTFAYADGSETPALRNISFKAEPGQTIAFIGSTGSGKSTLIQLIPRFYDTNSGSVLIDGIDVKDMNIHGLREKIGFIPQKAVLFSGSIADNIRYGNPDASLAEIMDACEIAQAKNFIEKKDGGYEHILSEAGANLSGGQKQRLSIARALVRKPKIYVFDDSFSALDYRTDAILRKELRKHTMDATVLIVAQRIGTIMHADQIIVIHKGEIVARGTHKQLLRDSEIYYDIAASQLSKEELSC